MQENVKMKKYNTTIARLLEIIVSMSEKQQSEMLRHAEDLIKSDRRISVRKSCDLQVDFAASDRTHKGYIKNISQHGLFIAGRAPVVIGKEVLMVFKLKRNSKATKLRGEIAHATRWGIGVEFTEKGPQFDEEIRAIIQRI
jgi:Tfp pilus assembly protein PilZ